MSVIAAAIIGTAAVGAYSANQQNKAARDAAKQQQQGISEAQVLSLAAADEARDVLQPVVDASMSARAPADAIAGAYGSQTGNAISSITDQQKPLDVSQFLDPSMAFAQKEGQKAIQGSAAARGGLLSGATLKELTSYSQGLATQNYNNAVGQAMQNRSQQLNVGNQLLGMSDSALNFYNNRYNTGLNAIGQQANIASQQGTNASNLAMSSANVGAAATAGQRDPLASGLGAALGMAGAIYSDEGLKKEIDDVSEDEVSEFLDNLNAVSYDYTEKAMKKGAPAGKQVGIIAQDAEKSKMGKKMVVEDYEGDRQLDIPKTVSALLASTVVMNNRLKKIEGKK